MLNNTHIVNNSVTDEFGGGGAGGVDNYYTGTPEAKLLGESMLIFSSTFANNSGPVRWNTLEPHLNQPVLRVFVT
jgi:hypothetical protein